MPAALPILAGIVLAIVAMVMGPLLARADMADIKVALVIGNAKYQSADVLKNPANDAVAVKNALMSIGFNVVLKQDVTEQEFEITLKEFARDASKSDIALFYFAGHGVQFQSQNYFLPVDTKLVDSNDIEFDTMPMDRVVSATSKAHKTKIIVLDACRNKISEHSKSASRSLPDIGVSEGFAPITGNIANADGMIVFYSAEPGKQADDGEGAANSPFAQSFAKRIVERNEKIQDIFHLVSSDVYASTNKFQHPEIAADELTSNVILNPAETAEEVWARIAKSNDRSAFRQFIKDFPDSPLADAAQAVLDNYDLHHRLDEAETAKKEEEQRAAAAAAEKAALEQRIAEAKAAEQARLDKEKADQDAAAKALAEKQAQLAAEKQAAQDLVAEEKRKADAAAAEQARIAKEKADKEAEAKRLADEAAEAKKKADEADAARKEAEREAAEKKAQEAAAAAEAAKQLEAAKQQAKLEEDARKKQAEEAAAKVVAAACARDQADLAQLMEAKQSDAIQALRAHSVCPAIPAAADQAIKQIASYQAKLCADDQKTLARIDPKNEDALKATLDTLKCPAIRANASAQIAKLEDDNLRAQKACADERETFASINVFVPGAREKLSALPRSPACQGLATDIQGAIASVDKRVADAQGELRRLGCYTAKPTGRFDGATITAIADYLKGRNGSPDAPKITDALIDELRQQDFVVCVPPPPSVVQPPPSIAAHPAGAPPSVAARPAVTPPAPKRILARPELLISPRPLMAHSRQPSEFRPAAVAHQIIQHQPTPKASAAPPSPYFIPAY